MDEQQVERRASNRETLEVSNSTKRGDHLGRRRQLSKGYRVSSIEDFDGELMVKELFESKSAV